MSMQLNGNALVAVRLMVTNSGDPLTNTNPVEFPLSQVLAATPATASAAGTVKRGVAVPNAVAAPTKAEFDALLVSLRTAGVIAT